MTSKTDKVTKKRVSELEAQVRQQNDLLRVYEMLLKEKERTIQVLTESLNIIKETTESNKMSTVMNLSQIAKGGGNDNDNGDQGQQMQE